MITVWVTKYALTSGVLKMDCELVMIGDSGNQYAKTKDNMTFFRMDRDAFLHKEEAFQAAEVMRLKKIANLKKQLSKLEKLKFLE